MIYVFLTLVINRMSGPISHSIVRLLKLKRKCYIGGKYLKIIVSIRTNALVTTHTTQQRAKLQHYIFLIFNVIPILLIQHFNFKL
jgi:hypothetical protein